MPKQILPLEPNGRPRLELTWGDYMRNFEIKLDGRPIGRIDGGRAELTKEQVFVLPDGSTLSVQLRQKFMVEELQLLRDGRPLPGSASDPERKLSAAVRAAFSAGVAALAGGLGIVLLGWDALRAFTLSEYSAVAGLLLIGLAVWMARRAPLAAAVAFVALIADGALALVLHQAQGASFSIGVTLGIMARVFFAVPIFQGFSALRAAPAEAARPQPERDLR